MVPVPAGPGRSGLVRVGAGQRGFPRSFVRRHPGRSVVVRLTICLTRNQVRGASSTDRRRPRSRTRSRRHPVARRALRRRSAGRRPPRGCPDSAPRQGCEDESRSRAMMRVTGACAVRGPRLAEECRIVVFAEPDPGSRCEATEHAERCGGFDGHCTEPRLIRRQLRPHRRRRPRAALLLVSLRQPAW
jgi:hypothetical protein